MRKNDKTKVLHVISDKNFGGAGRVLINLLRCGNKNAFDYAVALPRGSALIEHINETGTELFELNGMDDESFSWKAVSSLRPVLKQFAPDIVHCHAAASAKLASRFFAPDAKVVYTRHSVFTVPEHRKRFPYRQIYNIMDNFSSDMCIAVSPAARDNVTLLGGSAGKIRVVYNGTQPVAPATSAQKEAARKSFGIPQDAFVAVMAARLVEIKGFRYALEAFRRFEREGKNVCLLIAGSGPMEAELSAAAKGSRNIFFAGFAADMLPVYHASDLFLSASYETEATSMAVLEAMSAGIPAAVSDFGGNPFIVENNVSGLIFAKKDADAIYRAVLPISEDREIYERMSAAAELRFHRMFDASAMASNTEACYTELLR